MFGQLRIASCSLNPEQQESYRADFCSLCHSLKSQEGALATLLTNYDSTFWLQIASGLNPSPTTVRKRCTAVPLRSVWVSQHTLEVSRSNVSILMLLLRAKAEDDLEDEGSLKAKMALRFSVKKAARAEEYLSQLGFPTEVIRQLAPDQSQAERAPNPSFHDVVRPTRVMMGEVFAHLAVVCQRPEKLAQLRTFGAALGEAIYLLDALDDHDDDLNRGRFNPLLRCPEMSTRVQVLAIAQRAGSTLELAFGDLDLLDPSRAVLSSAVARLSKKLRSHSFLGVVSVGELNRCRPRRRQRQAAFCGIGFCLSSGEGKKESCCTRCRESCDCDCCELPDCCGDFSDCCGCDWSACNCDGCDGSACDCSSCDCSACDCSGCDCGGCDCCGC